MLPPKTASYLSLCVLLLCLTIPDRVSAHNGAVAIAVPVEGITIDGDLSDWPERMREYPITNTDTGEAVDPDDLQAFFRLGYSVSEKALYVAVVVDDQSTVIDTTAGGRLDPQDGCDVFVNLRHAEEDASALHQYVIWGHTRKVYYAAKLVDAEVETRGTGARTTTSGAWICMPSGRERCRSRLAPSWVWRSPSGIWMWMALPPTCGGGLLSEGRGPAYGGTQCWSGTWHPSACSKEVSAGKTWKRALGWG